MEGNDRRPMLARLVRAHPRARWRAALVAALPWLAWASLGTGAHAGPPPSADLAPIADALGAAGIGIRAEWPEGEVLTFVRPTTRYRDRQGDPEVLMTARILRRKGIRWLEIEAPSVFDLDAEEHAAAAMRALLAAPTRMTSMPTFSYDEDDGTVSAFRLIPLQGESLPSDQLATVVEGMVDSVDGAYAVVERVLRTGVVEWPLHGNGPTKGQGAFEVTVSDQGASQSVSWAIHEPPAVHASAVISAGAFMRSYLDADDDRRDRIAGKFVEDFGPAVRKVGARRIRNGLKRFAEAYPPFAVRFFGSPGPEVTVTVTAPGLLRVPATGSATLDEFSFVDVRPVPEWDVDALRAIHEPREFEVQYRVCCRHECETVTRSVRVLPGGIADLSFPGELALAGFVDETHPWIPQLVREAAELDIAPGISHTGNESLEDVIPEIFAVWTALRNRDLRFTSMAEATEVEGASQRVRRVHEAIGERGANCADGTVLLASILRSIGHDVHVVTTPGHALVGLYFDTAEPANWLFIETTLLGGTPPPSPSTYLDWAEAGIPERFLGEAWGNFELACAVGNETVQEQMRQGNVVLASVGTLRSMGIRPITSPRDTVGTIPTLPDQQALAARRAEAWERRNMRVREAADDSTERLPAHPVDGREVRGPVPDSCRARNQVLHPDGR